MSREWHKKRGSNSKQNWYGFFRNLKNCLKLYRSLKNWYYIKSSSKAPLSPKSAPLHSSLSPWFCLVNHPLPFSHWHTGLHGSHLLPLLLLFFCCCCRAFVNVAAAARLFLLPPAAAAVSAVVASVSAACCGCCSSCCCCLFYYWPIYNRRLELMGLVMYIPHASNDHDATIGRSNSEGQWT